MRKQRLEPKTQHHFAVESVKEAIMVPCGKFLERMRKRCLYCVHWDMKECSHPQIHSHRDLKCHSDLQILKHMYQKTITSLTHQSSAHLSRWVNTNYHFVCINNTPHSFFLSLNWWLGVVECACYKATAHLLPSMPNTSLTGWRPGWVSCNRWQTANVGSTLSMLKHAMVWHRLLSHECESAPKSNKLQITATKATKMCFPFLEEVSEDESKK